MKTHILLIALFFPFFLFSQNSCIENDTIQIDTISSGVYSAENTITINSVVKENANILLSSGQSITLLPGFQMLSNSTLTTILEECQAEASVKNNVIIIEESTNDNLLEINSTTIRYDENGPQVPQIIENCIIISDTTSMAPKGYLRKVINVQNSNGQVILTTENVSLKDAINSANFEFEEDLVDPTSLNNSEMKTEIENTQSVNSTSAFHFNLPDYPVGSDLVLSGSVSLDPKLVFEFTKLEGLDNPINFKIGSTGTMNFDIDVKYVPSSSSFMEEIELYSKQLKPIVKCIPIPTPPFCIPIIIVPELEVKLITQLTGPSVELNYQTDGEYQAVIRKLGDNWLSDSNNDLSFTGNFAEISVGTLNGSIKLRLELDFDLYDLEFLEAFVFTEGEGSINVEPNSCTIESTVRVGAGLEIDALEAIGFEDDEISLSYDYDFGEIEFNHTPPTPSNYVLEFDGIDDQVVSVGSTNLNDNTNYAIECWARIDDLNKSNFLVEIGDFQGDKWLWHNGSSFVIGHRNGNTPQNIFFNYPLTEGQWFHVAYTYFSSSNTFRLWVNGNFLGVQNGGVLPNSGGTPKVWLGRQISGTVPNSFLDGAIDEVRYWDNARSAGQIMFYRDKEFDTDDYGLDATGIKAYYKFSAPNSTCADVIDCSGNNFHGVRSGSGGSNLEPNYVENNEFMTQLTELCTVNCTPLLNNPIPSYSLESDVFNKKNRALQIIPNPTQSDFNIEFELSEEGLIEVDLFSVSGRLIKSIIPLSMYNRGNHIVSVESIGLETGMYILKFKSKEKVHTKKLMISK